MKIDHRHFKLQHATWQGADSMGKIVKGWNLSEKYIVGILGLTTTILAFSNTLLRYLFQYSPEWMEEIIVYLIIWAGFIIASTLVEERRHVGATFLVDHLPPKMHRLIELITSLLALGFCVLVLFLGYKIVHISYVTDQRSLTGMRYALWMFYLSLPVGLTLMTVRYAKRIYGLLFHFNSYNSEDGQ